MRVITPLDLRRSLGRILDEASLGERFLIERDRLPLAMLVSVEDGHRLEEDVNARVDRQLAALDRLDTLGRQMREQGLFDGGDGETAAETIRRQRDERVQHVLDVLDRDRAAASDAEVKAKDGRT